MQCLKSKKNSSLHSRFEIRTKENKSGRFAFFFLRLFYGFPLTRLPTLENHHWNEGEKAFKKIFLMQISNAVERQFP